MPDPYFPANFPNSIAVNSFTAAYDPPLSIRRPAGQRIDWNLDGKPESPPRD